MLLRVAEQAYVRSAPLSDGREIQGLIECPQCRAISDWLIAAAGDRVEFACRCGHRWQIPTSLLRVVALAECQPIDPQWTCLNDAQRALGFARPTRASSARGLRRSGHR
jgi:hypothetical protein